MVTLNLNGSICQVSDQVAINVMGLRTVKYVLIPEEVKIRGDFNPDLYFISYAECVANKDRLLRSIRDDLFDD